MIEKFTNLLLGGLVTTLVINLIITQYFYKINNYLPLQQYLGCKGDSSLRQHEGVYDICPLCMGRQYILA